MSILLFKLRGVPDDEADDIRTILSEHRIDYYETTAGNWGISLPAIWLKDEPRLHEAKALIEQYETKRLSEAKIAFAQQQEKGRTRTLYDVIVQEPIRFVIYIIIIAVILYFSIVPFLKLGG
jgi:hypothetical protein